MPIKKIRGESGKGVYTVQNFLINNEAAIRGFFFFGGFIIVAVLERIMPKREMAIPRKKRWFGNIGLVFLNSIILRLTFPFLTVGLAIFCEKHGWGFLNYLDWPYSLKFIATLLFFDIAIYLQHVTVHFVPLFWRLHRLHHSDMDYDVTTGLRFHIIEIIASVLLKMVFVAGVGPPAAALILSETMLNLTAMFNHGNINIPVKVDKILRLVFITPDMHRIHHSAIPSETNSNYGFVLPWWDWICGSYVAQPKKGHLDMTIGLKEFRDPKFLKLQWLMAQPFINDKGIEKK